MSARKATNVTLDAALLHEARTHGVNLSRAAEDGLRAAVESARKEAWQRENRAMLEASNRWIETNGLPLEAHRLF